MTTQKSRKNPRAQVTLVARYRSPTAFEYVEEHCFDLSSGGMFIESNAPAPAGTLIKLECDVNEGAGTLRGVARVVWLREQPSEGQPKGMGVKFLKLEPGGRELILQLLGERASLPPTESIPPSRRSWAASVASPPRSSGGPVASSSAQPSSRASLGAPTPARTVAVQQAADPPEPPAVARPAPGQASEAALSAFAAITSQGAEAPGAPSASPSAGDELASGAVSIAAASSAVLAVDRQVHEPAGGGGAAAHQPAAAADASHAGQTTAEHADAGHGPEHGAAAAHDHRPHAHELRERLARRAAAQRAAAASAVAPQAVQVETPRAPMATSASPAHSAVPDASGPAAVAEPAAWQEPARAPEPAPQAVPASVKSEPRSSAAAEGGVAPRLVSDERREFTLKGDVPVEEMPKRRGAIYLALIAAGIVLILILQARKGHEPEPTAAVEAPAAPSAAPAAAPEPPPAAAPEPAPPAEPTPAPSYVLELSTRPEGATVQVGDQSSTTPAQLALGTLDAPVTVRVQKEGFEPDSLAIDRTGFVLEGGQLRRHVTLSLSALAPPPPPPPAVAAKKPEPAPPPPPAKTADAERPPRHRRARSTASATPAPEPADAAEPEPTPPAEPEPAAAESPLQVAMACLARGDNPCVVRALEGKASSPRELELLIETHRAMGNAGKAEQLMQSYIDKYPSERRATTYRRQLERKAAESGGEGTTAPAPE